MLDTSFVQRASVVVAAVAVEGSVTCVFLVFRNGVLAAVVRLGGDGVVVIHHLQGQHGKPGTRLIGPGQA